jgi:acyl dehydratase
VATVHRLRARNTATASANRIHDDAVARRYGFGGGLVPGVDLYGYLLRPVVAAWGRPWLEGGRAEARFTAPVYDGDEVTVEAHAADDGEGGGLALRLTDAGARPCAAGTARPADRPAAPVDLADWPEAPLPRPEDRPPAGPASLVAGALLGTVETVFRADLARAYLAEVGDPETLYAAEGLAHPAWLLQRANRVLAANVVLGPWIHAASEVRHLAPVEDGDVVSTRARVLGTSERKGHRIVELDVVSVVAGSSPVNRIHHTAIYEPRVRR